MFDKKFLINLFSPLLDILNFDMIPMSATIVDNELEKEKLFAEDVRKKREITERVTLIIPLLYLINVFASYMVLRNLMLNITENQSFIPFLYVYAWNIVVMVFVAYMFNKYKF